MLKLPPVQSAYYPMAGGLDLLTPAIAMNPGKLFDSQNYEPEISGGYRRIDGYERYDGRPSPSSASYWIVDIEQTGTITNGSTITGATSGATGRVLGVFGSVLVLGRVVGDFDIGEDLQISAVTVAVANSQSLQDGSPIAADDAEYTYLASNDYRADILAVPGSGQIRGVWVYNDITYAFRDNVGGTAGNMWKSSAGGWVQITFGNEIQFSGAVAQIFDGCAIRGATGGGTSIVTPTMDIRWRRHFDHQRHHWHIPERRRTARWWRQEGRQRITCHRYYSSSRWPTGVRERQLHGGSQWLEGLWSRWCKPRI